MQRNFDGKVKREKSPAIGCGSITQRANADDCADSSGQLFEENFKTCTDKSTLPNRAGIV